VLNANAGSNRQKKCISLFCSSAADSVSKQYRLQIQKTPEDFPCFNSINHAPSAKGKTMMRPTNLESNQVSGKEARKDKGRDWMRTRRSVDLLVLEDGVRADVGKAEGHALYLMGQRHRLTERARAEQQRRASLPASILLRLRQLLLRVVTG